ncbi:MAG TPA: C25 family cysteine peptidase [Puia sp.]|nr:C25 family cysteine peptidase [Puia sp.]
MKKIYTIVLLLLTLRLAAQPYNNEWIDYSKTYYKFKVGANGIYRIPQATLAAAGMGAVPAQNFQLFRNGREVPIYTTVASGPLGASDYVEFWGQINDGVPDQPLYRSPAYQHTTHWSLETDTAVYFLTVNPAGTAFHYANTVNNVAGSPLTPEPYFMYTAGNYMRDGGINPGFAQVVGEYIYSSSYDIGEFWSTSAIVPGHPHGWVLNNLAVYAAGPPATIKFGMAGTADNPRNVQVTVDGTVVADTTINSFYDLLTTRSVPLSAINSNATTFIFYNNCTVPTDRMVGSFFELTYPRLFDFGGQTTFPFQLPARSSGYLLNITNFSISASATPVLYDLANGLRYTGVVSGPTVSFALTGSANTYDLVLVNEDPSTVQSVTTLTPKTFVNYQDPANQGNYIIISNPYLYNDGTNDGVNPVTDYKNYRSSAAGGGFNAQVYDINDLVDQFAFGIKKHPLSIQNFLRYARANFAAKPQFVLLLGHGMTYNDYNTYSEQLHDRLADVLNLVPTYGYPASDNKLSGNNGVDAVPITPIGRLSVGNGAEIETYLAKVKEYEQAQQSAPNTIEGRLWMKNFLHLTGVSEPYLGTILCNYMYYYQQLISDTLYGANVYTQCDGNASPVVQVPTSFIGTLFNIGFSALNYFGHSSNTVLDYNLDNPSDYNNPGKYPMFFVNGCDAGDFFIYDPQRPSGISKTLSENFELAKERGTIDFIASSSFQIVNYCNIYLTNLYGLMDAQDYGKPIGVLQKDAVQALMNAAPGDYFARLHAEQLVINGDPYEKLNQGPTDYDVEASTVVVNPSFISASNTSFTLNAKFYNLGRAVKDSVGVLIERTYPNGTMAVLFNKKIKGIRYADSVQLTIPINPTKDLGDNKITVTIDPGNVIPEADYNNNSVTTDVYIYQNGATPVFPYNYSIINKPGAKLVASTNNPLLPSAQYTMQLDTTQSFNSPSLITKNLTSIGGELEFDPGIVFQDSTVYYWRVASVPAQGGQYMWSNASFVYIDSLRSGPGSNQSHYFQHLGSTGDSVYMAANRHWTFLPTPHNFYLSNAMYPYAGHIFEQNFAVGVDGNNYIMSACLGHSLMFNVFDPVTLQAWKDVDSAGNNLYKYGSASANCNSYNNWDFEFSYMNAASRHLMTNFMDSIPNGYYVIVRSFDFDSVTKNSFSSTWHNDTTVYGAGKSLYNYLKNAGFGGIDSLYFARDWEFIYKKGDNGFIPQWKLSQGLYDEISQSVDVTGTLYAGTVSSPAFGPAAKWGSVHWRGHDGASPATDTVGIKVIGLDTLGNATTLYNLKRSVQDFDISAVNPKQYPMIQLKMATEDHINAVPYQLDYWRVNYTPEPEGALAPNITLKAQDTILQGQNIELEIAFKNVSPYAFDSMAIRMYIVDAHNVTHTITLPKRRPIASGDTLLLDYVLPSAGYAGANTIYLDFNPNAQPEQYLFNNFLYKSVYVRTDLRAPTLDVTFDNVHILNNDIVSARPHVSIKLQSQSEYLLLKDTSLMTVQVQYPDGSLHPYYFNTDTLRFTPASSANNNVATIDFTPAFTTQYNAQGDTYQLIVTGKDELGTAAGAVPYRVSFKIITKPMISNMLNYPNPFTTSTAFVFTITGSQVPQNLKIEIMTITGRVVREITKEELGPLHIGTNITEFKWNGTDMYGQRLANGVYLYHVVTNLNGQSLGKYSGSGDNTDKYFNNGYGKMYLMR